MRVELWLTTTTRPLPNGAHLAPAEEAAASAIAHPGRRAAFMHARTVLRERLGAHLRLPAAAVPLRIAADGRVEVGGETRWWVSIAHSGTLVLVACTDVAPVGVDVEQIDPQVDRAAIARRFFAPEEEALLARLDETAACAAFFAGWVRKEALLKARGTLLSTALREAVVVTPPHMPPPTALPPAFGSPEGWTLADVEVGEGYAAAVAVARRGVRVMLRRWPGDLAGRP